MPTPSLLSPPAPPPPALPARAGTARLLARLRGLLGSDGVLGPDQALRVHGHDTTGCERVIVAAVRPADRAQAMAAVRLLLAERIPFYPVSAGRNWGYGTSQPAADGCIVLDLGGLRRVLHFDPELGTVTVEPGVTQADLAGFLAERGAPFLVPVSGAGPQASLLGNALERGYGITPGCDHFAGITNLEVMLPDGSLWGPTLAALGGETIARGFKWGIGPYLDGMFTQGSFGVALAGTIALARRPACVQAMVFQVGDDGLAGAVEGVRECLRRLPGVVGGINLMNRHRVLAMAMPWTRDLAGGDGLIPEETVRREAARRGIAAWNGFGTLYGTARAVAAARAEIRTLLRGRARRLLFVGPAAARRLAWLSHRLPAWLAGGLASKLDLLEGALDLVDGRPSEAALPLCYWRGGARGAPSDPARDGCGLRWYAPLVPMRPDEVRSFAATTAATLRGAGFEPLITLTSLSERCFDATVPLLFDRSDPAESARAACCHRRLLDQGCARGWVPYRVGIDEQAWLAGRLGPAWDLVGRVKAAIDPHGLVAPGRYCPRAPAAG
ncbi:MAG: FAD-binding oxidoreductase [Planctomycetes bacterium]|nr:FAD-binding oxidoreductase [Planctomycetota bacterium]